jgi:hypothetical protein
MYNYIKKKNDNCMINNNICPYNYYGYCENENCKLIHLKPNMPTLCLNYIKHGICKKQNCKRIHKNVKMNKPCIFYNKNKCNYGNKCNFIHIEKNKNNYDNKCNFIHVEKYNNIINNKLCNENIRIIKVNNCDILYDINKNNFYYINTNYVNIPILKRSKSF